MSNKPTILDEPFKSNKPEVATVDVSHIPILLNAASIRVLYHPSQDSNHKIPTTADYTLLVINQDGSEEPMPFVQSFKFELDIDEGYPSVTISYIDHHPNSR